MLTRFTPLSSRLVVLGLVAGVAACSGLAGLKARKAFKDGNSAYQERRYREATEAYQQVLASMSAEEIRADNNLNTVYFFLGHSYDSLYKPTRTDDPENSRFADEAVKYYRMAAENSNPQFQELALQYLFAMYAPDKLDQPQLAEQVGREIIAARPNEVGGYYALAKHYENIGAMEQAEPLLLKAIEIAPSEEAKVGAYNNLADFYNRQGEFDKTVAAYGEVAKLRPEDPTAPLRLAQFYEEKARKDTTISEADRRQYVDAGLVAADQALEIKSDYMEAMVYKGILLRAKAKYVNDRDEYDAMIAEAKALQDKALELQKRQTGAAEKATEGEG